MASWITTEIRAMPDHRAAVPERRERRGMADSLRDAVAEALLAVSPLPQVWDEHWDELTKGQRQDFRRVADAVLAVVEARRLPARQRTVAEIVKELRGIASDFGNGECDHPAVAEAADLIEQRFGAKKEEDDG